jgi:hypothetical protein
MWLFTRGNNEPDAASMANQGAFVAPKVCKAAPAKTAKEVMDTPKRLAWADVGYPNSIAPNQAHEEVIRLTGARPAMIAAIRDAGASINTAGGNAIWAEQLSPGIIDVHLRSYSWCSDQLAPASSRLHLAVQTSNGTLHEELKRVRDALNNSLTVPAGGFLAQQ